MSYCQKPTRRRIAFTLIEILVVVAIIGILAVLVVGGVMKVTQGQRLGNTRTMIKTIDKTLKEHWAYVVKEAQKETGLDVPFQAMNNVFGPDLTAGERNRIIWIKLRLMEAFPISYADVASPYPYTANTTGIIPGNMRKYNSTYVKLLGGKANDNKGGATESSACLLMALSVMRGGTSLNIDALGASYVADSDGDGLKEFVDGWGNPLTFFRFPTDNAQLQNSYPGTTFPADKYWRDTSLAPPDPANGGYDAAVPFTSKTKIKDSVFTDPVDMSGILFTWPSGSGRKTFETNVHKIAFNSKAACYVVPAIVSWGPDGDLNRTDVNGNPSPYGLGLDSNTAPKSMLIPPVPPVTNETFKEQELDNVYSFLLP